MSYSAILIESGVTVGTVRQWRDLAGVWYIYRVDWENSADGRILRSTDNGKTWSVYLTGAPGGTNFVWPMIDQQDRLYVGVPKDGANNTPRLFYFDESIVTPAWVAVHNFTLLTTAINPSWSIDTFHTAGSSYKGYPIFYCTYNHQPGASGAYNAYWADTEGNLDLRIDTTGGQSPGNNNSQWNPKSAIAPGGKAWIGWVEAGTQNSVYLKYRIEGTATLSTRIKMSAGAGVTVLEDIAINPTTGLPTVLFTAATKLYIADLLDDGSTTLEKVWDGTNDYSHTGTRAKLAFDLRGSLYVLAEPIVSGTESRKVYYQIRALNHTGWFVATVDTNGDTTIQGDPLDDFGYFRFGLFPSSMAQGNAGLHWVRADGQPISNSSLYLVFPDRYPGTGVYPDIEMSVTGSLPPRREEILEDLPSIVLSGEGASATSYPFIPDQIYAEEPERPENLIRYEIGQIGGRPKFADGRRVVVLRQNVLDRADFATLRTYLNARYKDLKAMSVQRPDQAPATTFDAFPIQNTLTWDRIGPDQYRCENKVLEIL